MDAPIAESMAGLAPHEWRALAVMARQHRLEPLLHRNLEALPQWTVPEEIRRALARKPIAGAAFRALACERVIGQIARHLDASGVPYAALKGAWLAFHAYPHPALRPLRDIDILVPSDCANGSSSSCSRRASCRAMPRNHQRSMPCRMASTWRGSFRRLIKSASRFIIGF